MKPIHITDPVEINLLRQYRKLDVGRQNVLLRLLKAFADIAADRKRAARASAGPQRKRSSDRDRKVGA